MKQVGAALCLWFAASLGLAASLGSSASAAENVIFLLPAPATLPAFAPFQLAKAEGYYAAAGLNVSFQTAKGGVDVAKQVAVGNADFGGGIGDTAIILRANGLPVKGVALLGGKALTQIIVRDDANVHSFADLKGKQIGVLSYEESAYFNLLAVLASSGLTQRDASIEAVGPGGVVQLMISGRLAAISAAPDLGAAVEAAGVKVDYLPIDAAFPAMAQAILASDKMIAQKPQEVRAFVQATLRAVREIIADPGKAARAFVAATPQNAGREASVERIMKLYVRLVYPTDPPQRLGAFDPARVAAVEKFYVAHKIVRNAIASDSVFTNSFVN